MGTAAWVTATEAIRVGAMNSPLRISRPAVGSGCTTNGSGISERASSTAPTRNRLAGPAVQVMVPVTTPAIREPPAHAITITPAYGRIPASSAKAMMTTSMPPNIIPSAAQANTIGTSSPGDSRAEERRSVRDARGGSVCRWAARARAPTKPTTPPAASPRAGCTEVARKVASTGPTMKTASSSTASQANAVFSSGVSRSRWLQRARTAAPAEEKPSPTPTAVSRVQAIGASSSTVVISAPMLRL